MKSIKEMAKQALKKIKDTIPLVKKGKYHGAKGSFGIALDQTNELNEEITELLASRRELREELARREITGGGYQPNPNHEYDNSTHDLEAENYLLREVSEALVKEKAELEKVIASLETDKQQQKEEFEKKLAQSQQSIERIEERLVECCSKCLIEEEETKENLDKAKKEIFQLCERMGVEISPQLKKDIEKADAYKDLLTNLIKIHDARMIEMNQEGSEEETKPAEVSQISPSTSQSKVNPGVKYFLWITGILALISFILFIVKKGKLGTSKPGKKQK